MQTQHIVKIHRQVRDWLSSRREPRLQAQARLDLLELAARGQTKRVKSVAGKNKGWLRSPLGGGGAVIRAGAVVRAGFVDEFSAHAEAFPRAPRKRLFPRVPARPSAGTRKRRRIEYSRGLANASV